MATAATRVFSVFTKPWKMPLPELGAFVARLGFDGVELPVRPGFQVEPGSVGRGLPAAVQTLAACGVRVHSVAGPTDEATVAACADAGVPLIRVCVEIPEGRGYLEFVSEVRRRWQALVPTLRRAGVAVGVQNHCGRSVGSAMGVRELIAGFDSRQVCAVWDPAHCALAGEPPELAADILGSHLRLVNLKNVLWRRTNGPEAEVACYQHHWTSGAQGLCPWPAVAEVLRCRGYEGPVCLTAEYSAAGEAERLIAADLAYARRLFA